MDSRLTIYDVAREAGVSPATVSRVFLRPERVKKSTAEHVAKVAEHLGYGRAQSTTAVGVPRRSEVIGIVVSDISNPYCVQIIRGVQDVMVAQDLTLQLVDTRESGELEGKALQRVTGVDGLILTSPLAATRTIIGASYVRPVVLVNRVIRGLPTVLVDNEGGARAAVDHLAGSGHTTIVYVAGSEESWVTRSRWGALQARAQELGIRSQLLGHFPASYAGGREAAKQLRELGHVGVIAHNDLMAMGINRVLYEGGSRVPQGDCIIGFDGTAAAMAVPARSTIAAPLRAVGSAAAQLLLDLLSGRADSATRIVLPSRLVVRDSARSHCPAV